METQQRRDLGCSGLVHWQRATDIATTLNSANDICLRFPGRLTPRGLMRAPKLGRSYLRARPLYENDGTAFVVGWHIDLHQFVLRRSRHYTRDGRCSPAFGSLSTLWESRIVKVRVYDNRVNLG